MKIKSCLLPLNGIRLSTADELLGEQNKNERERERHIQKIYGRNKLAGACNTPYNEKGGTRWTHKMRKKSPF